MQLKIEIEKVEIAQYGVMFITYASCNQVCYFRETSVEGKVTSVKLRCTTLNHLLTIYFQENFWA